MKKTSEEKIRLYAPGPTDVEFDFINSDKRIMHHRAKIFKPLYSNLRKQFNKLVSNSGDSIIITGSGTSGMDMAVNSYADKAGKNIIFAGGTFGRRWQKIFQGYKIDAEFIDVGMTTLIDLELVKKHIKGKDIRKAFFTHVETSSGWKNKIKEIGLELKKQEIGVVVDAVASIGADKFMMDDWGVSILITAIQKGLNLPPGLAVVAYSNEAKEEINKGTTIGFYLDMKAYLKWNEEDFNPYTPAVSLMYSLEKRLNGIFEYGYEGWFAKRKYIADILRMGLIELGLKYNAAESPAGGVTVVYLPEGIQPGHFKEEIYNRFHIFFAGGRDELVDKTFRIGHFNPFDIEDIFYCINAIGITLSGMKSGINTDKALQKVNEEISKIPSAK